jgi:type IV pilus assembly protein PilB
MIPIHRKKNTILVAFTDPLDRKDLDAARQVFGPDITPAFALRSSITETIQKMKAGVKARKTIDVIDDSVIGLVDNIITDATNQNASDIHIEPMSDRLRVRFRLDGVLIHYKDFGRQIIPTLSSRLKVMCHADIAEKRRHQGGRILFEQDGLRVDLRLSFYITIFGENIVIRLLNRQNNIIAIDEIGMYPRVFERFKEKALNRPSGVVMVTGPTGSGKTTTIYSCIDYLNSPQMSILTAEDPVEYVIEGIAQCSIDPKVNVTFEETLRHIVRQDPDIVVIGEIRDPFSAEVAVQAALTGHKVLTTFHTEDSIGGLIRLLDMDIEAFLVSSTVVSVVAQRLLRKPCSVCATDYQPTISELRRIGYTPDELAGASFVLGKGCAKCRHTGYNGRTAVLELLVLDELVRDAILERKTSHEIRQISMGSTGLVTLLEDGILKASDGITTIAEVLRCLPQLQKPRPLEELRRLTGA